MDVRKHKVLNMWCVGYVGDMPADVDRLVSKWTRIIPGGDGRGDTEAYVWTSTLERLASAQQMLSDLRARTYGAMFSWCGCCVSLDMHRGHECVWFQ